MSKTVIKAPHSIDTSRRPRVQCNADVAELPLDKKGCDRIVPGPGARVCTADR
jgi:hypothetical protein